MCGQMANNTMASGTKIRCTATEFYSGKMAKSTRATLSMTKERVRANSPGRMGESTTVCGKMASSTERANLLLKMDRKGLANGIMVEKLDGYSEKIDLTTVQISNITSLKRIVYTSLAGTQITYTYYIIAQLMYVILSFIFIDKFLKID